MFDIFKDYKPASVETLKKLEEKLSSPNLDWVNADGCCVGGVDHPQAEAVRQMIKRQIEGSKPS